MAGVYLYKNHYTLKNWKKDKASV